MCEAALIKYRTSLELVVNHKWAGVDIANWVDQTHHASGAAQI
jgi:hypothetical protein